MKPTEAVLPAVHTREDGEGHGLDPLLSLKLDESTEQIANKLELVAQACGEPLELTTSDFLATVRLAEEHGITFYEATYVAIAERIGRTVVSADRDLVEPGLAVDLETTTRA